MSFSMKENLNISLIKIKKKLYKEFFNISLKEKFFMKNVYSNKFVENCL